MKRFLTAFGLAFFLFVLPLVSVSWGESFRSFDLDLEGGYRVDELDWNIAGANDLDEFVNVLSELTWEDLEIYQVKANGKVLIDNETSPFSFCMRGMVDYGWIVDGENQDSDYAGDNRTLEFSRSNNSSDDGDVFDFSAGIGFQFRMFSDRLTITPLVGYSYHEQNLTITDGEQTISEQSIADDAYGPGEVNLPPLGSFDGLDSTYETQWYGPWTGVDLEFRPNSNWSLFSTIEYHWAYYEAEANWNLRDDFQHPKSFEHEADGYGVLFSLGSSYAIDSHWALTLDLTYQDWWTDAGTDRVFFADGTVGETRLNEVNWESYSAMVGVKCSFF